MKYRRTKADLQHRPTRHILRAQNIARVLDLADGPLGLGLASRLADMRDLPGEVQEDLAIQMIDLLDEALDNHNIRQRKEVKNGN